MKKIIFSIIIYLPFALAGQERIVFDTNFANNSSVNFFRENPGIDAIIYTTHDGISERVQVFSKIKWQAGANKNGFTDNYDYYKFDFVGDTYLFNKKYGQIIFPTKEISLIAKKSCTISYVLELVIRADSIRCVQRYPCPTPNADTSDYEIVFTRSEKEPNFKNGVIHLQNQIEKEFYKRPQIVCAPLDSILIYKILVDRKDPCLKEIELIEGQYSAFEQFVLDELKRSCSWIPAIQGSRAVMSYTKIFIKLNKDKSITVAI